MHRILSLLLSLQVLVLVACNKSSELPSSYFDSLVMADGAYLLAAKASVSKRAIMNGKEDHSVFTPDSLGWENELSIFRQLSVFERPAYLSSYRVEDGLKDGNSNLVIRRYTAKQPTPVSELQFYYYNQFKNLKKIEAVYRQENLLYATRRRLVMEFEDIHGKSVLTGYSMEGVQKMVLSDSVKFFVQSRIAN